MLAHLRISATGELSLGFPGAPPEAAQERSHRVEILVVHALLERDDRVVGDVDVLGADLGAAFRDVAVADSGLSLEQRPPIEHVLWMHLEARDPNHESRALESSLQVVGPQNVADVLAQEALDAFAKLHHALDVLLLHPPGLAACRVLLARCERRYLLVDLVIPAAVRDKVLDDREGLHRANAQLSPVLGDGRLAHEAWKAVDLGRARPALGRLAVPSHGEVRGHVGLDPCLLYTS